MKNNSYPILFMRMVACLSVPLFCLGIACECYATLASAHTLSVEDNMKIHGIRGDTVSDILKSARLEDKIDKRIFRFFDIDPEAHIQKDARVPRDSSELLIWMAEDDDRGLQYAFSLDSGRLRRYILRVPAIDIISLPKDLDWRAHIIPFDQALAKLTELMGILVPGETPEPDTLTIYEFPNPAENLWRYSSFATHKGIQCDRCVKICFNAFTGTMVSLNLHNVHIPLPEQTEPKIPLETAWKTARLLAQKHGLQTGEVENAALYIARPSNVWMPDAVYNQNIYEEVFRLCWRIEIFSCAGEFKKPAGSIFVDALTGDVMGGHRPPY